MTTYLLDANVLISLMVEGHPDHERATQWATGVHHFAVCPVAEGAVVRLIFRMGGSAETAIDSLRQLRTRRGYEFWSDSLSYEEVAIGHIRGHRQVTDAYLVSLAGSRPNALLATLDEGLVEVLPALTSLLPVLL